MNVDPQVKIAGLTRFLAECLAQLELDGWVPMGTYANDGLPRGVVEFSPTLDEAGLPVFERIRLPFRAGLQGPTLSADEESRETVAGVRRDGVHPDGGCADPAGDGAVRGGRAGGGDPAVVDWSDPGGPVHFAESFGSTLRWDAAKGQLRAIIPTNSCYRRWGDVKAAKAARQGKQG